MATPYPDVVTACRQLTELPTHEFVGLYEAAINGSDPRGCPGFENVADLFSDSAGGTPTVNKSIVGAFFFAAICHQEAIKIRMSKIAAEARRVLGWPEV